VSYKQGQRLKVNNYALCDINVSDSSELFASSAAPNTLLVFVVVLAEKPLKLFLVTRHHRIRAPSAFFSVFFLFTSTGKKHQRLRVHIDLIME